MNASKELTVGLDNMTPEAATAAFDELQKKLVPLWKSIECFNQDEQTIVVVPSMSMDMNSGGALLQAFEERFLFLLFLLSQPNARVIYVTSQTIDPSVVEYYLGLISGIIPSHARARLHLIAPMDGSCSPLSLKLLQRPAFLERIRSLIPDPDRAHLVCYNTTWLERNLAIQLGIPMYGADPKFFPLGTKSGCRQIFTKAGISHPQGREDLKSIPDLVDALADMRAKKPDIKQVVVKLNEGVSGAGNALLDVTGLPAPGSAGEKEAIEQRLQKIQFEKASLKFEDYFQKFSDWGGIVEERIGVGAHELRSPSVQLRVTPLGKVELLSTHDQMLGGPSGQSYLGCIFPADPGYAVAMTREAAKVGELLAKEGVIGRFALDFVVTREREDAPWETYAIEINLRKGGTTHPFLTLQFLTGGKYDPETGIFTAPNGHHKFIVATDHLESHASRGFTPDDLFDLVVRHGLHFGQIRQTGVVFHMLPALGECGRVGMTAVGNTPAEAQEIYDRAIATIGKEAAAAWKEI